MIEIEDENKENQVVTFYGEVYCYWKFRSMQDHIGPMQSLNIYTYGRPQNFSREGKHRIFKKYLFTKVLHILTVYSLEILCNTCVREYIFKSLLACLVENDVFNGYVQEIRA